MTWTNMVNVSTGSTTNTIKKTGGVDGWNGGASSTQSIAAGNNGYVQSVALDRSRHTIFGLSNGDQGQGYEDIDFAIHLQGEVDGWPGDLVIYEGGAEKHRINSTQQNPAYVAGDVLKVAVTNGVVKYYKNEVLLYTSQSTPVFPLLLDASVFHLNAKVQDAWLCSSGGGSDSRPGAGGNGGNSTASTKEGTPTATSTRSSATSSSTATATATATVASAKSINTAITPNPTSVYRGSTPGAPAKLATPSTPGIPQKPQKPQSPNSPNVVNTLIYLHSDHLGSVSVATNASGGVVSQQEYDPWGKVRSGGVTQTKINYTGQKLDGMGLLYYHARMYDPGLGRFISADTIVQNSSNPQTLNRYSYVLNNPVRYTDPSGHCTVENLGCTVSDFDRMSAEERIAWVRAFQKYWGLGNVFNGVIGTIMYFRDSDVIDFTPGKSWTSLADAYTLAAMQDGMGFYKYGDKFKSKNFNDVAGLRGPEEWAKFYDMYNRNGKNLYAAGVAEQWGRAEKAAVGYAVQQADRVRGRPGGEEGTVIQTVLTATDGFRNGLISRGLPFFLQGTYWDPSADPERHRSQALFVEGVTRVLIAAGGAMQCPQTDPACYRP